jgi:hypothetical protein
MVAPVAVLTLVAALVATVAGLRPRAPTALQDAADRAAVRPRPVHQWHGSETRIAPCHCMRALYYLITWRAVWRVVCETSTKALFSSPESAAARRRAVGRAPPHCCVALPLIRFIPDSRTYSVPLFLKRRCDRTLAVGAAGAGAAVCAHAAERAGLHRVLADVPRFGPSWGG